MNLSYADLITLQVLTDNAIQSARQYAKASPEQAAFWSARIQQLESISRNLSIGQFEQSQDRLDLLDDTQAF